MMAARGKRLQAQTPEAAGGARTGGENRKARLIVEAARKVFLEQGYDVSSTDLIARTAGVSKATVYAHFESKEALLIALIEDEMRTRAPTALWEPEPWPLDVEATLHSIARRFTGFFLSGEGFGLHRLMIAQAPRFPEIGRFFYVAGPKKHQAQVAAFLRAAVEQDLLTVPDIDLAATQFLSLVRGELPLNSMLALGAPTKREVDALVEGGVRVFLAAYRGPRLTPPPVAD
jgi:TetR/AcrR family transcriptional regulator, mexJK operon transcriptional repressor